MLLCSAAGIALLAPVALAVLVSGLDVVAPLGHSAHRHVHFVDTPPAPVREPNADPSLRPTPIPVAFHTTGDLPDFGLTGPGLMTHAAFVALTLVCLWRLGPVVSIACTRPALARDPPPRAATT